MCHLFGNTAPDVAIRPWETRCVASTLDRPQKPRTSIAGSVSTPVQVLLTEGTVIALGTLAASVRKLTGLVLKHHSKYRYTLWD